ncbi:tetratricopeptide repeat protein [bacterium]|nr:tetratricopeptide repeat protein [bacterium]
MDLKTKSLAGSLVSSAYSNPALICGEKSPSLYAEYSDLFYGLNKLDNPVQGYYPPDADKMVLAAIFPYKNYGMGVSRNLLTTPIHKESKTSFLLARNLNDLITRRFEESIDVAASFNICSLEFTHFPYENYSNSATTFSWDFFISAKFTDGFEYGLAFKNLGNTDIGFKEKEPLPREFNFSLAKKISNIKLIFSYQDYLQMPDYGLGAEYNIKGLNIMTGINSNYFSAAAQFLLKERIEFSFGVSVPFVGDIAFQPDIAVKYYFSTAGAQVDKLGEMKIYYNRAYEAYIDKRFEEAIQNWEQVLKLNPEHILAKKNIVKARADSKKYYFNLATYEYKMGNYEKAIDFWQKVLAIYPSHDLSKQKIEKARKRLESGEQSFPTDKPTYEESNEKWQKEKLFREAVTEYRNGNYTKAIELWRAVLAIDPSHEISKIRIKDAEEKLKNQDAGAEEKPNEQ